MLDALTKEDWAKQIDENFQIRSDDINSYSIKLINVSGYGRSMGGDREAYSLLFCGPVTPVLPQQIYRISSTKTGEFDIFLVPIGPQSGGMVYEAVFT